jgi:uncharacterized membrane protein
VEKREPESLRFQWPPHPQLLLQYNEVVPDAAERIVSLAEDQVHHRHAMELRGQTFAFILAAVTVLGAISAGLQL